jgi:hypothetical protein
VRIQIVARGDLSSDSSSEICSRGGRVRWPRIESRNRADTACDRGTSHPPRVAYGTTMARVGTERIKVVTTSKRHMLISVVDGTVRSGSVPTRFHRFESPQVGAGRSYEEKSKRVLDLCAAPTPTTSRQCPSPATRRLAVERLKPRASTSRDRRSPVRHACARRTRRAWRGRARRSVHTAARPGRSRRLQRSSAGCRVARRRIV